MAYIVCGITSDFRIGVDPSLINGQFQSTNSNMQSTRDNAQVIDSSLNRVIGPLPVDTPGIHVNRFGVIPKANQPDKWRLIVDLSHPTDFSVNDGIPQTLCSLRYVTVDLAVHIIRQCGKGALLAKLDLESAYRIVPVHPSDHWFLGMKWKGALYVDAALPFGLRSAPKIFNAVADALLWIMGFQGVPLGIHYLDDFLLVHGEAWNRGLRPLHSDSPGDMSDTGSPSGTP